MAAGCSRSPGTRRAARPPRPAGAPDRTRAHPREARQAPAARRSRALRLRSRVCSSLVCMLTTRAPEVAGGPPGNPWAALLTCRAAPLRHCTAGQRCEPDRLELDGVAAEVAVKSGDLEEAPVLVRVADPVVHLGDAARVAAVADIQGFPGREQLGGLELQLLHRHVRHWCLLRGVPPGPDRPGDLPARHPVAPGHGPGVRYLPNALYGHHRTVPITGQSMP